MKKWILRMMLIAVIVLAMLPVPNAAAADTYTITTTTAANGSFTVMVNGVEGTSAAAGDTVTITATPDSGHVMDVVTITKTSNGEDVTSAIKNPGAGNTRTFIMPAYNVTVSANFPVGQTGLWGGVDWAFVVTNESNGTGTLTIAPTSTPADQLEIKPRSNPEARYEVGDWREAIKYGASANEDTNYWPYDRTKVTNLVIKEGVKRVGSFVAAAMSNATGELVIPSSVIFIGWEAFNGSGFTKVTFAEKADNQSNEITPDLCIATGGFKHMKGITSITLPERLKCLHEWAFQGCSNLKTVNILSKTASMNSGGTGHKDYADGPGGSSGSSFADIPNLETITFANETVRDRFIAVNAATKDPVTAYNGLTCYGSLQDALDAAAENSSDSTVTLIQNMAHNNNASYNDAIKADEVITIHEGVTLIVPAGKSLNSDGTIVNFGNLESKGTVTVSGTGALSNHGTVIGNGSITNSGTYAAADGTTSIPETLMPKTYSTTTASAVKFNANGGAGKTASQSLMAGSSLNLSENAFTRTGYNFAGWSTAPDGPVTYLDQQTLDTLSGNVTLYAVWSKDPVISGTFDTVPGDAVTAIKLTDINGTEYSGVIRLSDGEYICSATAPAGIYQLVTGTETGGTVSDLITLTGNTTLNVDLTTGNTSSVEIADGAPKALVGGLPNVPGSVKFTVTAEPADSSPEQTAIKTEAGSKTLQFIGLTLSENGADIGGDNENLLTIVIPFAKGSKQNITVYRFHDSVAAAMPEGESNAVNGEYFVVGSDSITVYAKKFSLYAIGYTSSTPRTYRVTSAKAENGTVSTDYKSVRAGRSVTITVNADPLYVVKAVTVTTSAGKSIAVTYKGNGKYTFTMPASAVTVSAEFGLPFTDIDPDHKFTPAIEWVYTHGLMIGRSETTFDRTSDVNRQQVWMVLSRLLTDHDFQTMAEAGAWAMGQGISDGTNPTAAATREEFITMMWIAYGKPTADTAVLDAFSDADSIAADARTAMAWAVEAGITVGYEDGTMRPAAATTRGAFAAVLHRYLTA